MRQADIERIEEICVRLVGASPHAAAQLVELSESQPLRVIHDDGIDVRYVQPVLDNGAAQKDISLFVREGHHDAFQLPLVHLAVRHYHPRLRDDTS